MEGRDKSYMIIILTLVINLALKLPISVIDKHDDPGSDRAQLDKHLFLVFEVVLPELLDDIFQPDGLLFKVESNLLLVFEYELETAAKLYNNFHL